MFAIRSDEKDFEMMEPTLHQRWNRLTGGGAIGVNKIWRTQWRDSTLSRKDTMLSETLVMQRPYCGDCRMDWVINRLKRLPKICVFR